MNLRNGCKTAYNRNNNVNGVKRKNIQSENDSSVTLVYDCINVSKFAHHKVSKLNVHDNSFIEFRIVKLKSTVKTLVKSSLPHFLLLYF